MRLVNVLKSVILKARNLLKPNPDRFLRHAKGVIHVGANSGQERDQYAALGLPVVWIEPIPEVFAKLTANLRGFPRQRAVQALVTDRDDVEYNFHVANNSGASSSIFDFGLHKDIWPEVGYERTIKITSKTLARVLEEEKVDVARYDVLVMDTQGSELLVLKGAEPLLPHFSFIKTEVPDFESYAGCVQLPELTEFLVRNGFRELSRHRFARHSSGGSYFDIVYSRRRA